MKNFLLACILSATAAACAQQPPATPPATPPANQTDAPRAVAAVLRHYLLNPTAKIPETNLPLDTKGTWSVAQGRPEICPPDAADTCLRLHYKEPGTTVDCSWVVLLKPLPADTQFLDENQDAEKYLTRKMTPEEAKTLILNQPAPIFPPIASAAHVGGIQDVKITVDANGIAKSTLSQDGPLMLKGAITDATNQWKFAPLQIAGRAIPYEVHIRFTGQWGAAMSGVFAVHVQ